MRTHLAPAIIATLLSLALAGGCDGGSADLQSAGGADSSGPGSTVDNGGAKAPGGGEPGGGSETGGKGGSVGGQGSGGTADAAGGSANFGSAADASASAPPVDPAVPGEWPAGEDAGSSAAADAGPVGEPDAAAPTCNTTDPVVLYMSADDSTSMAGATVARGLIAQGQLVTKAVRTYEMLNYYSFAYPAAEPGHVAVSAQLRDTGGGAYALQIGVRAPDYDAATRRRINVVLSVDTSSSMGWGPQGKRGIDRAREACKALVAALDAGDVISLATWGGAPKTLIDNQLMTGKDDGALAATCEALTADGLTDFSAGLKAAYGLAAESFGAARINRVVLLSDGGANVGDTDEALIANAAKDANGEAIYLMGIGVGDPWNYNDGLMNAVTDAGKGAYVFLDDGSEAWSVFGEGLMRHMEVAARDVHVQVTLPPTFAVTAFHGEEISTDPEEVEPQHLAANDAMIFHQIVESCDPGAITGDDVVSVTATWEDPVTREAMTDSWEASFAALLEGEQALLRKGDAVVAYAEALHDAQTLKGAAGTARIDEGIEAVVAGIAELAGDADLQELLALLQAYRKVFEDGPIDRWPTGGTGADPISLGCGSCNGTGDTLNAMACALDICGPALVSQTYGSPTDSTTGGTFAAVAHYGDKANDLEPQVGGGYAVMATGPALGTAHSQDMGGVNMTDSFQKGGASVFNAMEWRLVLKAPPGANGLRFKHVFFSQEYDDYVGTSYNDKFYAVLEAGSTNGGTPTVINVTQCRDPDQYYDVVCSPGMQFCNPRQRYCYIAINTALSECCWLGGCPDGTATTDISGTGFSCAPDASQDSETHGSSTGWLVTEWPIEPGETFTLTFHVHDTGDGIFDSAVILDGLQFVSSVTPGTWQVLATK